MNVLALDTSSKAASCAVWRDGILLGENFVNAGLTHSQTIMPMLQSLLRDTGATLPEMDLLAVSIGPGSFTGLRIGLSAVKGMALALDKPCAGISTLRGLAENVSFFTGYLVPVMDARRNQVYTATFACASGRMRRCSEDGALSIEALGDHLRALGGAPVMLVGDGAALCRESLTGVDNLLLAPPALLHQRAASVAQVAATEGVPTSAEQLEPAYLRLPQAQRELLEKQKEEQEK